jgi:hypothetical protein
VFALEAAPSAVIPYRHHVRIFSGFDPPEAKVMFLSERHAPSVKLLMASLFGDSAMYLNVTSACPSLIIKCTMIRDLKTIVHVESRSRSCSVRKISATPASPPFVAPRIASTYFDFGAAS